MDPKIIELASNRISEQFSPKQIAAELKMQTGEIIEHLFVAVGKGRIRESDLFFALDEKYKGHHDTLGNYLDYSRERLRAKLRTLLKCFGEELLEGYLPADSDVDELELYISYLKRRVFVGDIYLFLTELERTLHSKIGHVLKQKFGSKDSGWWKRGVPEVVRVSCAEARERDQESVDHAYHFTTFIHLQKIIDKNWELFSSTLPQAVIKDKKGFLKEIEALNSIRNQVMHPVRNEPPTEDDFKFIRKMHEKLNPKFWR